MWVSLAINWRARAPKDGEVWSARSRTSAGGQSKHWRDLQLGRRLLPLCQDHIYATPVHIDDFEAPARPGEMVSRFRQHLKHPEHEPRQRDKITSWSRYLRLNELHHLTKGNGCIDQV